MLDPQRALQVQMMLDSNGTQSSCMVFAGRVINDAAQIVPFRSGPDRMKILFACRTVEPAAFPVPIQPLPPFCYPTVSWVSASAW